MSKRQSNPAAGLAGRRGEAHPVVAATIFSHQFNDSGIGATMGAHDNEVAKPFTPGYIVGSQPDRTGRKIPTQYEHDMQHAQRLDTILGHARRVRTATAGQPLSAMGYWRDHESSEPTATEVDASTVFHDRRTAVKVGKHRDEKAVWDLGKMAEIRLDGKGRR